MPSIVLGKWQTRVDQELYCYLLERVRRYAFTKTETKKLMNYVRTNVPKASYMGWREHRGMLVVRESP